MSRSIYTGYRFDTFEVQAQKRILLRNGHRVRIQRLPFQMLLMLLERPGELISREDICKSLWSNSTYVEFDNGLNVAAAKLREALGDDPMTPLYVKTVSRQGYQFVADVVVVMAVEPVLEPNMERPSAGVVADPGSESSVGLVFQPAIPPLLLAANPGEVLSRWTVLVTKMLLIGLAAAILCGVLYKFLDRPLVLPTDRVLLGGVRNYTDDPSLDNLFSSALRFKLQESPFLSLVEDQNFRRSSSMDDSGHRSSSSSLIDGLKACTDFGAQLFLAGQVLRRPVGYRAEVDAWRCSDGRLLAMQSAEAPSQSEILQAFEIAAISMRRRLGEPESSLVGFNAPLVQATTNSLAALRAFTKGETDQLSGNELDAATNYKLAVDLDSQFALAYARLGAIYTNARDHALGRQYFQKAFELRERTTDREKLYLAAHYYAEVLGDIPRGIDAYQLWKSLYPHDVIPVENLGSILEKLGEPDKALTLEQKAVQMRPDGTIRFALLAVAELEAGRYAELNNTFCNDPKYEQVDEVMIHYSCYLLALEKNDESSMERQLSWGRSKKQESVLLEHAAWAEMSRGKLADARRTFTEARESAARNDLTEFSAELDLDEAWLDADLGFAEEAHALTTRALKLAPLEGNTQAFAALTLARSGNGQQAETAMALVSAKESQNTLLMTGVLPAARAAEAMYLHDPKAAIRLLEQARSMDDVDSLGLAPAYYRGLAYLQDHRYDDAAREFRQVMDHRALLPESLYVQLSRLELGHTLQLSGHHEEALKQYHQLDEIWAQADPNFPALLQLHQFERSNN